MPPRFKFTVRDKQGMRIGVVIRLGLVVLVLAVLGLSLAAPALAQTAAPGKVRFLLFYSETCPHCHEVMENYLPGVYDKYGDQVEHRYIQIGEGDNYVTMLALEEKMGVPADNQGYVPALFIGDQVLVGGQEIPERLEGLIDQYLAQGGVDYPSLEDLPAVVTPTPSPSVQVFLFYHPQDPGLADLRIWLNTKSLSYNGQLEVIAGDRTGSTYMPLYEQIAANLDKQPGPTDPVLVIDHQFLIGAAAIRERLPDLVSKYLAEGGKSLPPLEELTGQATPAPTATPVVHKPPIYMAYFDKAGCQECARTTNDLAVVKKQFPQLVVETYPIEQNQALNEWLCQQYDVPEDKRLSTPMIFVGDEVLIGTEANLKTLTAAVGKYAEAGAPREWDGFDENAGKTGIVERFKQFGVLTVLGAGLIDGLNPCAFATLVFFISYMALTGRRGRDILLVGAAFALGVFLTYLLVGVGLSKVISSLGFFPSLGRWVYVLTALLCVVLAALTFRDFLKARRGQASEMTLKLPLSLRRRINRVIREGSQMRAFVGVAFLTGFVVSLIELACTGQVYLPTIMFVLSEPGMASQAFFYLLLYCIMFIIPLVVVFVLAYFGTTSEQFGRVIEQHTATVKALTGALFVGLALWMTWTLAPLFGIQSPWTWILLVVVLAVIAAGVVAAVRLDKRKPTPKKRAATRQRRSRA
jgi:cytochrome c biogenesis protein CcdA/glutaredoxin